MKNCGTAVNLQELFLGDLVSFVLLDSYDADHSCRIT